jgi:hypothetical protein
MPFQGMDSTNKDYEFYGKIRANNEPSSKGAADRKKETLSDKAKDVEESIKRGLHID